MHSRNIKFIEWDTLPSTNQFCKENISFFDPVSLTVVTADIQTAGKGTQGREWLFVGKENLYVSFVFFLEKNTSSLEVLSHLLSLSIIEALSFLDIHTTLKWPNDILLNGKKLAGILTEVITEKDFIFCVAGFGLNVSATAKELAPLEGKATSLFQETSEKIEKQPLLKSIAEIFLKNLKTFEEKGFSPFLSFFEEKLK